MAMNDMAPVYADLNQLSTLKAQANTDPEQAIKEVAAQFESMFVSMMMKSMRDALPGDSLFSSNQMETYQEMFDQQLAVDLSNKGGLGLAEIIEQQLRKSTSFQQFLKESEMPSEQSGDK